MKNVLYSTEVCTWKENLRRTYSAYRLMSGPKLYHQHPYFLNYLKLQQTELLCTHHKYISIGNVCELDSDCFCVTWTKDVRDNNPVDEL